MIQLTPCPPFWSENRAGNWHKNMRLHRAWAQVTEDCFRRLPNPLKRRLAGKPASVTVHLTFPTSRRRDPHNYVGTVCKAVVDGLVHAGVFPDDTPEWVTVTEPVLGVGPAAASVKLDPLPGRHRNAVQVR